MERKGQHLFNEIAKRYKLTDAVSADGGVYPYVNLHKILFYMTDKEFNEIMAEIACKGCDGTGKDPKLGALPCVLCKGSGKNQNSGYDQ